MLTHNEILTSVSLYYLTKSFISSGFIYYQNRFATNYTKAKTDAPLLFSSFKYNILFWPAALVKQTGNLVVYKSQYQIASFDYKSLTWYRSRFWWPFPCVGQSSRHGIRSPRNWRLLEIVAANMNPIYKCLLRWSLHGEEKSSVGGVC